MQYLYHSPLKCGLSHPTARARMYLNVDGFVLFWVHVDPLVLGNPMVVLALVGIQRHLGLGQTNRVQGLSRVDCGWVIFGWPNSDEGTSGRGEALTVSHRQPARRVACGTTWLEYNRADTDLTQHTSPACIKHNMCLPQTHNMCDQDWTIATVYCAP